MKKIIAAITLISCLAARAQKVPPLKEQSSFDGAPWQLTPTHRTTTVNECDTWTFQQQLASAASEQPADALQLPTGSYIIVGNDSSFNEGIRGRIIKLNAQGGIVASKSLTIGTDMFLHRVRLFGDGKLYAIGTLRHRAAGISRPFWITIDTASLAVSATELAVNNGPMNWRGVDLLESADRSACFLLMANDSLLNVTRVDHLAGTVTWSKTYKPRTAPRPVGMGVEFGDVYVAWNETDTGYSKAVMMALNQANGNYRYGSRSGGGATGLNIELHSITMANLRPRLSAIEWDNDGYRASRMEYQVNAYPMYKNVFTVDDLAPAAGTRSRTDFWSKTLAYQQENAPDRIHLIETYPDNARTPIRSRQFSFSYPATLRQLFMTYDGGHIILGNTETFPQRIVLVKTDSVGTLPGCNSTPKGAGFVFLQQAYKPDTIPASPFTFSNQATAFTIADVQLTLTEECKSLYCPQVPETDSCLRTFFKEYRIATNSSVTRGVAAAGAGKFLLQAAVRANPYVAVAETQFAIIDTSGRLLGSKILINSQAIELGKMTKLRDGNLLGTGSVRTSSTTTDTYLVKFDTEFNIFWQKKMVIVNPPHYGGIEALVESAEGDFYCQLRDRSSATREVRIIMRLDATGNPVWVRQFDIGPSIFPQSNEFNPDIVEFGDDIIFKYNDDASDFSPYLVRIRKSDGAMIWVRKYQMAPPFTGSESYSLRNLVSDGRNIYMLGTSQGRHLLLKIAPDGSVVLAKRSPVNSPRLNSMGLGRNNRLLFGVAVSSSAGYVNGVIEMDTSFNQLRSQYMLVPKWGTQNTQLPYSDSVVYSAGSTWYDDLYTGSLYFQKYNFNSSFATCAVTDLQVAFETYNQPALPKSIGQAFPAVPQMVNQNAAFVPAHMAYSAYYCGSNTACTDIDLQGPATICDSSNIYDFAVDRNASCKGNTVWVLDTAAAQMQVVSMTDNLLRIKVRNGGSFTIRAKVFANCGWLEDSVAVQATAASGTLDLGSDLAICPGNNITLHAGPGFGSYLWQNGSTDSVLTVSQPGVYYVQVASCGNTLTDTIRVNAAAPIPFSAGPDRTKCNNDTLHLDATPGFMNYSWSNNYNISSLTAPGVTVNPLMDTAYYVRAEKTPGCFAFDTVRITVYHSLPVSLGADKSFCTGDSAVFDAGPGFANYTWSNGATEQQVVVKSAGQYSVIATSAQGCKSYDTVRVLNVHALPLVNLNKNSAICEGTVKTLSAGNFASYAWSTGVSASSIQISAIGRYWVTVTDANGCKGSDTSVLTTIHPLPKDFLPADTAVCSYGSIELKPLTSYSGYLWSNGRSTPSITVSQPATYWLEVTDANTCKGRDSLVVNPKDCLKGFYIPSAFTPNGDGRNDVFRPLLFGVVKQYQFTVYNRWGQIIYTTNDLKKGWDGNYAGAAQGNHVFVWTCSFQFDGEAVRKEKGTVVLIR